MLLVARDPRWLYAHWDLTEAHSWPQPPVTTGHLALRVCGEIPRNAAGAQQEVHPESRNWFLNSSARARPTWRSSDCTIPRVSGSASQPRAQPLPRPKTSRQASYALKRSPSKSPGNNSWPCVEEATSKHPPLLEAVLGNRSSLAAGRPVRPQEARHRSDQLNAPIASGSGPAPTACGPRSFRRPAWTPEKERALAELISIDEVRRVWVSPRDHGTTPTPPGARPLIGRTASLWRRRGCHHRGVGEASSSLSEPLSSPAGAGEVAGPACSSDSR